MRSFHPPYHRSVPTIRADKDNERRHFSQFATCPAGTGISMESVLEEQSHEAVRLLHDKHTIYTRPLAAPVYTYE